MASARWSAAVTKLRGPLSDTCRCSTSPRSRLRLRPARRAALIMTFSTAECSMAASVALPKARRKGGAGHSASPVRGRRAAPSAGGGEVLGTRSRVGSHVPTPRRFATRPSPLQGGGRGRGGGFDGVSCEDRLGLDRVYVQAKRFKDTKVDRTECQAFVGSLV